MSSSEIKELQDRIEQLEETIKVLNKAKAQINKDALPIGLKIYAEVDNVGKVWLQTTRDNYKVIEINEQPLIKGARFKSLSAAAEFFSKIKRKSGWVYWRTAEGRTLKDAYKG